ncbi:family 25 glycosyl hydrolase [Lactococcus sp. dk322]|nr:family 25 glycosyl hydrolase [Lactococcus sp. dk101]TXK36884.1 family 25 glycosyl hydrolase [Lactococcus sp. dk310]TXK45889.1 family 25 glycosyl hydrolase [Lactococcus sp. dk322]
MGSFITASLLDETESDTESVSSSSNRLRSAAGTQNGWGTDAYGNTTYYLNGVKKTVGIIAHPNDDGYTYAYSDSTKSTVIAKRLDHAGDINKSLTNLNTDVVDIASYQYWMKQSDFYQIKTQGVKTVVIKLTESTNYINDYAKSQIQMAKNAGLNIATYHFAIFGKTSNQATANSAAIAEAKYYASQAQSLGLPSNTVMILDAEYAGTASSVWTNASIAFKNQMTVSGYPQVKYYTSKSWVTGGAMNASTLGTKNLWVAQYLFGTPKTNATGWGNILDNNSQYGALQYSSQMYFNNQSSVQPVDTSVDLSNFFNRIPALSTPIYRLYNPNNLEHLYTSSLNEKNTLVNIGWGKYEGISYYAPRSGGTPVYRLYHPGIRMHLYTTDTNEKNVLSKSGWKYEGTVFYADTKVTGNIPVYRLYHSGIKQHLFTTDANEKNVLSKSGWKYEGIAWYGRNY